MSPSPITRRHLLLGGIGGALGSWTVAGCAHGPGGAPEGSFRQPDVAVPDEYADRTVVVAWSAFGGGNGKAMATLANRFNQSQSDIYLALQFQGGYGPTHQKFIAALQDGTAPDMIIVNEAIQGELEMQQLAEPLNEYFDEATLQRFTPVLLNECNINGQIYQIPFARSTPLFYYNRQLYAKAGLPDRGPRTWDEFVAWSHKIQQLTDPHGDAMLPLLLSTSNWFYQAFVWQWSGHLSEGLTVTVNQDGAVEAAQFMRRLFRDQHYAAVGAQDTFTNQFAANGIFSTAGMATIEEVSDFDVGADFLPMHQQRAVPTGGSGWTIPRGIARTHKQAAAEVIKFLARAENAAYWTAHTGYVPVVSDALEGKAFQDKVAENPNFGVAVKQLKYARVTDPVRSFVPGSGQINSKYISLIYQSDQPLQPLLDAWRTKLQRAADIVQPQYDQLYGRS